MKAILIGKYAGWFWFVAIVLSLVSPWVGGTVIGTVLLVWLISETAKAGSFLTGMGVHALAAGAKDGWDRFGILKEASVPHKVFREAHRRYLANCERILASEMEPGQKETMLREERIELEKRLRDAME